MSALTSHTGELRAEIVSIGTELLLGEITDTNASWLAGQLPALGIPLYRITQVGDNQGRVVSALRDAWERVNLLILTGGLGPTEDDLTREAIAELVGERMAVVPELERELRDFFARRGREMPARNVKQAALIPSASALLNPIGTAPGWWVANGGRYIAAMPGVPVEMRRMWQDRVVPQLLALPRGGVIVARILKILGIGESAVEEQLGELVRSANPTVATYAKDDGIHVRLAARAPDTVQAQALIGPVEERVRAIFGSSIYGADGESLGSSTARWLADQGLRLAVAEAGLSGALCQAVGPEVLEGGLVLPPGSHSGDAAAAEAAALDLAERARHVFSAAVGLGAACLPGGADRVRLAAAISAGDVTAARSEEHRTDPSDAPRRAALLALQVLRTALAEGR